MMSFASINKHVWIMTFLSSYIHMHSANSWFHKILWIKMNCQKAMASLTKVQPRTKWGRWPTRSQISCRYLSLLRLEEFAFEMAFKKHWPSVSSWMIYFSSISFAYPFINIYKLSNSEVITGVSFVHLKIDPPKIYGILTNSSALLTLGVFQSLIRSFY